MGRVIIELLVVVAGILIAFQVEDFRAGRDARDQERAQLEALRGDLTATLARLDSIKDQQETAVASGSALVSIHAGDRPMPPVDSLALMILLVGTWYRLEPVTGAYDAMVNAGTIGRISNSTLLIQLASLYSDLEAGFEDQAETDAVLVELIRHESRYGLDVLGRGRFRQLRGFGVQERVPGPRVRALVAEAEYAYLAGRRAALENGRLWYYSRLEESIRRALVVIEEELRDGRS